jgi:hypothetical protein
LSVRGPGRRPARGAEEREAGRRPACGAEERKAGRQRLAPGGGGARGSGRLRCVALPRPLSVRGPGRRPARGAEEREAGR